METDGCKRTELKVRNLRGSEGWVGLRNLAFLAAPWSMPDELPWMPENIHPDDCSSLTVEDLRLLASERRISWSKKDTKESLQKRIEDFRTRDGFYLPFFEVKKNITQSKKGAKRVKFQEGELVYKVKSDGKAKSTIQTGVWILMEDSQPDFEYCLDARKGTFVRETSLPRGMEPLGGYRYVMTSVEATQGWVPERNLRLVDTTILEDQRDSADEQSARKRSATANWESSHFFRAVPFTDKVGRTLTQRESENMFQPPVRQKEPGEKFVFKPGDFLLDCGLRDVEDEGNGLVSRRTVAHVRNFEGEGGLAPLRGLRK